MSLSVFFFFKQKTAYEMRISDWSSDVCSSDLVAVDAGDGANGIVKLLHRQFDENGGQADAPRQACDAHATMMFIKLVQIVPDRPRYRGVIEQAAAHRFKWRSEEHTSELQSLMRISYAVFCLKKKRYNNIHFILLFLPISNNMKTHY